MGIFATGRLRSIMVVSRVFLLQVPLGFPFHGHPGAIFCVFLCKCVFESMDSILRLKWAMGKWQNLISGIGLGIDSSKPCTF